MRMTIIFVFFSTFNDVFFFQLLSSERLTIFAADLQVCFLLFESLRSHLKFHLEFYVAKLSEIIGSENLRTPYEMRELALDNLLQFCRIPGFAAELYINYDCNLYCTNLLEDLVKLLSKNTLSATAQLQIYSIHQMSLDCLLTIVENVERNCLAQKNAATTEGVSVAAAVTSGRHSRTNSRADTIVLDEGALTTGGGAGSGGESSGGIENITKFIMMDGGNAQRKDDGGGSAALSTITPLLLLEIKNKKRVS